MLIELHVKNLALIDEEEIEFSKGLNILTGETGAGKSIILGALSMALGEKVEKSMLRDGADEALVEAVFSVSDESLVRRLEEKGIEVYDGEVIMTRRISPARSAAKINGENVPARKLKECGALLIDIYGQQEHVSLTKRSKHLELLDTFAREDILPLLEDVAESYLQYKEVEKEYAGTSSDENERQKELLFLEHEVEEITLAELSPGEDERIEEEYERLSNSQKIMEALEAAFFCTGAEGASDMVGRALKEMLSVSEYDKEIASMAEALEDVDSILGDFNRDVRDYMDGAGYDGERFAELSDRLNTINRLKDKYGNTIEEILSELSKKEKRIEKLKGYDEYLGELSKRRELVTKTLDEACERLSSARKKAAGELCGLVRDELLELNFLDVRFDMEFNQSSDYHSNGYDEAEFVIALNPGAKCAPLKDIASGGELSRIMLALKTVLARGDATDTMIFDEIDAGISGRTAAAVSKKLKKVAADHQVICITHLPQIASKADVHFLIEKHLESDATVSAIHPLDEEGSVMELARMLASDEITEAVLANARELKALL